jgi:hypothetical protein
MLKPTQNSDCSGPAYDARGALSAECRACDKCDAVQRLLRELVAAQVNTETMRTANAVR